MAIREIISTWTVPNGRQGKSIMYCDSAVSLSDCRLAVDTLWKALAPLIVPGVTVVVEPESRQLDEVTGTLIGVGADMTVRSTVGTNVSADNVPGAAQLLLRWTTGEVVNGRRINGRTFVPGVTEASNVSGQMGSVTTASTAAQNYASGAAPVIWHRPSPISGSGGSMHSLLSGSAWSEWAVLRKRR